MTPDDTPAIRITPPLTLEEMKSFGVFRTVWCYPADSVPGAGYLLPREGMNYRPDSLRSDIQAVVSHFSEHTFAGYIEVRNSNTDNPPVARYYVQGRTVTRVEPMVMWPEIDPCFCCFCPGCRNCEPYPLPPNEGADYCECEPATTPTNDIRS